MTILPAGTAGPSEPPNFFSTCCCPGCFISRSLPAAPSQCPPPNHRYLQGPAHPGSTAQAQRRLHTALTVQTHAAPKDDAQLHTHVGVAAACLEPRSTTAPAPGAEVHDRGSLGDREMPSIFLLCFCFYTNDNISLLQEGLFVLLAAGILLIIVINIYMYVFIHTYLWDGHTLRQGGAGMCVCVCVCVCGSPHDLFCIAGSPCILLDTWMILNYIHNPD